MEDIDVAELYTRSFPTHAFLTNRRRSYMPTFNPIDALRAKLVMVVESSTIS